MPQPTMENTRQSLDAAAAAAAENIAVLYTSIRQAPDILDHIDAIPFVDTPLHVAASAGKTHFAKEILNLKPSLGRKLNPDGFSPLHLALRTLKDKKDIKDCQNNEELKSEIDKLRKTVKQLVKFDGELVRVRGRGMFTPLHLVAQEDDEVDLLVEFLRACPASIEDVTVRDETALHIAVKNSKFTTFQVLLGWLRENRNYRSVLNREDEEGNSVIHIAESKSQPQIVELLVKELSVEECNIQNDMNSTALDIAELGPPNEIVLDIEELGPPNDTSALIRRDTSAIRRKIRRDTSAIRRAIRDDTSAIRRDTSAIRGAIKKRKLSMEKNGELSMEMRNMVLVVAVLIATATYQAVLSPPGGGILDNKKFPTDDHIINGTINLLPGNNNITTPSNATIFLTTSTTNTTTNPMKRVLYRGPTTEVTVGSYFFVFYILNTVTFVSSIVVMMVVLPWHMNTKLLHATLTFLTFSYGYIFYVLVPSYWFATAIMISSSMVVASVYYVRGFRFIRNKRR